jgi:hypothetical protein
MCIFFFSGQKKYGIWRDFSEKFQVLCKNPDEFTRFDGMYEGINDKTFILFFKASHL